MPTYGTCPKKSEARKATIVDSCRRFFGNKLPSNTQYWTLAGNYIQNGYGELDQLLEEKLITSDQFYGVDNSEDIINNNKKLYPCSNWIHGDFYEIIKQQIVENKFNPAIINFDSTSGKDKFVIDLRRLLDLISYEYNGEVLLIANCILQHRALKDRPQDIIDALIDNGRYMIADCWKLFKNCFQYNGTGDTSTVMGTFSFVKEKHKNKPKFSEILKMLA